MANEKVLREDLAALELSALLRRPDNAQIPATEFIRDSVDQRLLGADNCQIRAQLFRQAGESWDVRQIRLNTLCVLRNSAISWSAPDIRDRATLPQLPNECVLPTPTSNDQNLHRSCHIMSYSAPCQQVSWLWPLCTDAISDLIELFMTHSPADPTANQRLSLNEIARILAPYVPKPVSDQQLTSIAKYLELLKKWNETIPLTSIQEDTELVARHFGESMFADSVLDMPLGRLADVGSGAGFPGLPLKIASPGLNVTLIEPNIKKCAFLREIQVSLGLSAVEIVRSRYEDFKAEPNSFDFICSRALGGYKRLLQWSSSVLKPQGRVILWLGSEDSNMLARTKGWIWDLPAKIPESRHRVLLTGRPAAPPR